MLYKKVILYCVPKKKKNVMIKTGKNNEYRHMQVSMIKRNAKRHNFEYKFCKNASSNFCIFIKTNKLNNY